MHSKKSSKLSKNNLSNNLSPSPKKKNNNVSISTENKNPNIDEDKFPVSPELISKYIIEKIFSLATYTSYSNEIENKIGNFCFDYLQQNMTNILQQKYICHSEKNKEQENELFFSSSIPIDSTFLEIPEPENPIYDRNESTFIKTSNPNQEKEELEKKGLHSIIDEEENEKSQKISPNHSTIIKKKKTKKNKEKKEEEKKEDKKKKILVIDLPSYEIPNIRSEYMHDNYDVEGIYDLRREREEEKAKKEKELREKLFAEKMAAKAASNNDKNKQKEKPFDFKKLTFDSNGNIISFKPIKVDNLQKEFTILKNNVKTFNSPPPTIKKKQNINNDEPPIKRKSIVIKNPGNPNELFDQKKKVEEKDKNEKIIPGGSCFNIMIPQVGVKITENKKTKQGNKDFSKFFNKTSNQDYEKLLNEYIPLQNRSMLQSKFGNMTNYEQKIENPKDINIKDEIEKSKITPNSPKKIEENKDKNQSHILNNPLLNNSNEIQSTNLNNNSNTYNNNASTMTNYLQNLRNPLFNSDENNLFFNTSNNILSSSNLDNTIKLTGKNIYNSSLKLEIEGIQDLGLYSSYNSYRTINNSNLFNPKKSGKIILPKINRLSTDMNKFNSSIINNKYWGVQQTKENEMYTEGNKFKKPSRNEQLRELGSTIMNSRKFKLPRDRKVKLKYTING